MFNYDANYKRDVTHWLLWLLTGVLAAAVLLTGFWMAGKASYDADVLSHSQQVDCIKNLGTPIYDGGKLECRK